MKHNEEKAKKEVEAKDAKQRQESDKK